jgi:hypothetical protein
MLLACGVACMRRLFRFEHFVLLLLLVVVVVVVVVFCAPLLDQHR